MAAYFPIINDGDQICLSALNGQDKRFKIINNGPTEATVSATLALPGGLTVGSYTASQGTFDSGTGIWSVGVLAANGSATIDFCLTVADTCTLPAVITLTVNNDGCVEADTGNNVGTRSIDGVKCCDIIACLGTIDFTFEADTTSTLGNNTLGTFTPVEGETIHFWSSDGTADLALAAVAGGGTIDITVPVSTDAGNLLTLGADTKHHIDVTDIVTALEAADELGRLYVDATTVGGAAPAPGATPANPDADPVKNSVHLEFYSDLNRWWTYNGATWTHVQDRSQEFTFTDGTNPFSTSLGSTITVDSPDSSVEVDTSVAGTVSLNSATHFATVQHTAYGTALITSASSDFYVVPQALNGWQITEVTFSSSGGAGTTSARLLKNAAIVGSLQALVNQATATESGLTEALATGDRIQVDGTISAGAPEGLAATIKIQKP